MIFRIVSSNTSSPASIKPCHSRQLPKRLPLRPVLILLLNVPETLERLSEDLYTLNNFNILCLEHLLKELIFLSFQETSSKSSIIFHHISGGFFFSFQTISWAWYFNIFEGSQPPLSSSQEYKKMCWLVCIMLT